MRPDTRSFSFTWLRGAQHQQELSLGRPTTRSQTVSIPSQANYASLDAVDSSPDGPLKVIPQKCSGSRRKLRRLGSSFLQNITNNSTKVGGDPKYDFMVEDVAFDGEDDADAESGESMNSENQNTVKPATLSLSKRLNKTVQEVKTTFESMSQRFRRSTSRRYRMKAETPSTPASPTRRILGRTPTKLYSPFGFDTPVRKTPKRVGADRASTPRLPLTASKAQSTVAGEDRNVKELRQSLNKFQFIPRGITRRSVRF